MADDDDDDDDDDAEVDSIGSDVESRRSSSVLEFVGIDCEEFSMSWPLSISWSTEKSSFDDPEKESKRSLFGEVSFESSSDSCDDSWK